MSKKNRKVTHASKMKAKRPNKNNSKKPPNNGSSIIVDNQKVIEN